MSHTSSGQFLRHAPNYMTLEEYYAIVNPVRELPNIPRSNAAVEHFMERIPWVRLQKNEATHEGMLVDYWNYTPIYTYNEEPTMDRNEKHLVYMCVKAWPHAGLVHVPGASTQSIDINYRMFPVCALHFTARQPCRISLIAPFNVDYVVHSNYSVPINEPGEPRENVAKWVAGQQTRSHAYPGDY